MPASPATDLNAQNFAFNQGSQNVKPNTIASAATIAPTGMTTFVTGTTQVATITPPLAGQHMLILIFTDANPGTTLTTGNISQAIVPTSNLPTFMVYNPITGLYTGGTLNLT